MRLGPFRRRLDIAPIVVGAPEMWAYMTSLGLGGLRQVPGLGQPQVVPDLRAGESIPEVPMRRYTTYDLSGRRVEHCHVLALPRMGG